MVKFVVYFQQPFGYPTGHGDLNKHNQLMTQGCTAAEPFALRVLGDNMLPEFKHGQIIIVDPAYPPCHGAFVVVNYMGEYLFGQLHKKDNRQWLQYLNGDQEPIELLGPFECKGVVIQRAGRRRDIKHYDYSA